MQDPIYPRSHRARISVLDPAQSDQGYLHVVVLDRYARSGVIVDSSLVGYDGA